MKTELETIKCNIEKARQTMEELKKELRTFWKNEIKEKFEVYEGIVVEYKGKKARVTRVQETEYYGKPWIYGNIEKKDGTFGAKESHLYQDWDLIKT